MWGSNDFCDDIAQARLRLVGILHFCFHGEKEVEEHLHSSIVQRTQTSCRVKVFSENKGRKRETCLIKKKISIYIFTFVNYVILENHFLLPRILFRTTWLFIYISKLFQKRKLISSILLLHIFGVWLNFMPENKDPVIIHVDTLYGTLSRMIRVCLHFTK